jgi:transposase-like protein
MIHQQAIHCPSCDKTDLRKNGKCTNGAQRYFCKSCQKQIRLTYSYNACKPGIKEKIIELTLNSSGVRDTGRIKTF